MRPRVAVMATLTLALLLLPGSASATAGSACEQSDYPPFGLAFVRLRAELGEVMGVPTTCVQPAANGDLLQRTSTGLAIYRTQTGAVLFASDEQHWALVGDALIRWTGNWHNGFDPPAPVPATAARMDLRLPQAGDALWSILVATLVGVQPDAPQTLLLETDGTTYQVQTGDGCPDAPQAVDGPVFVRTPERLDSPGAELVLLADQESCAIVTAAPLL